MNPAAQPQLLRSAPYFPVSDVERAAQYYELVLGFQRDYAVGTPPQFAIVSRDGLNVMLRLVSEPERISPNEQQGGTWDAFFWVRDLQALYRELCHRGAEIAYGPMVQVAYSMEEFAIRDRDGYVLGFGQPLVVPMIHTELDRGADRLTASVVAQRSSPQ